MKSGKNSDGTSCKRPVEHLYKELDQLNTKARELRLKYLPIAREKATKMKEKFKTNKGKYPFKNYLLPIIGLQTEQGSLTSSKMLLKRLIGVPAQAE